MRATKTHLTIALSLVVLAACSDSAESGPDTSEPMLLPTSAQVPASSSGSQAGSGKSSSDPTAKPAADAVYAEVVYVLLHTRRGGEGFCTGALVAKDVVVTAAHCLDPDVFSGFEVVAPLAPGRPRVAGSYASTMDGNYNLPEHPDLGILHLEQPIELEAYAELTDISARVEAGESVTGVAVVRTAEEPEAPLQVTMDFPVSSAVGLGYAYGITTPLFSQGGDSGAGLFLVEKGRRTRRLIGVARQPEPDRGLDHFTRIDPTVMQWFEKNTY